MASNEPAPASDVHDDSGIDAWFGEDETEIHDLESPTAANVDVDEPTTFGFDPKLQERAIKKVGAEDETATPAPAASTDAGATAAADEKTAESRQEAVLGYPPKLPEPTAEPAPEPTPESVPEPAPEPALEPALDADTTPETPSTPPGTELEPVQMTPSASTIASPVTSSVGEKATKHLSTMSFTRTVTNDVNWDAEDDDPEWDIPRSNTDPFQFMAPSDRSNSFPLVPSLAEKEAPSQHEELDPEPLESINEADEPRVAAKSESAPSTQSPQKAEAYAEHIDDAIDAWDLAADEDGEGESFFAGTGTDEGGDEARFEEGIPLIAHETVPEMPTEAAADATTPTEAHATTAHDPFAETDGGEEDDFFNNADASAGASANTEPARPPTFERKTTIQVLQSMNVGSLSHEDSLLEDEAAPEYAPIPEGPGPVENTAEAKKPNGSSNDLAAQWAAVLDDEDDIMLEDAGPEPTDATEVMGAAEAKGPDPAAFFGDDDEGFLADDADDIVAAAQPPAATPVQQQPAATTSRYLPPATQVPAQPPHQQPTQANPYLPGATFAAAQPPVPSPLTVIPAVAPSQFPINYGYGTPAQTLPSKQPRALHKAQSFADKSKGGYTSPYDLPMDVVKPPRKRQSMQQLPRAEAALAPPPGPPVQKSSITAFSTTRDNYAAATPPPPPLLASQMAPPPAATASHPPSQPPKHESFFEDLPVLPKVRPASRHSLPSPTQTTPYPPPPPALGITPPPPPQAQASRHPSPYAPAPAPQHMPTVPPPSTHYAPPVPSAPVAAPPQPVAAETTNAAIAGLVAPPRVSPYAALQSGPAVPPPAPGSTRYSPSPSQLPPPNGTAQATRYSPAPPSRGSSAGYSPVPAPPVLPHQPRTSSPLAHFEMSYDKPRSSSMAHPMVHGESHLADRRSSSSAFESRLNRVPSLPPTREEEEEHAPQMRPPSVGTGAQYYPPGPPSQTSHSSQTSQYSPLKPRHTPPPQTTAHGQSALSPPKRALNYAPQAETQHSPPRRSQTQSPSALYGNRSLPQSAEPVPPRPSSVHEPTYPTHRRSISQNLNLVPPTDGTETDPLQRWKGAPVFAWGVGGTFVSSFPQDVPLYGITQALPTIHRTAGLVQIKNIKELQPLEERLAKFPGPLKGKSKKKEVLAWLTTGIEGLERLLPSQSFAAQVSHEDKRLEERVLLWKILRLFIEHDGVLEGNPVVDTAVRDVLSPYTAEELTSAVEAAPSSPTLTRPGSGYPGLSGASGAAPHHGAQSDAVDSTIMEQIRKELLLGNKEKAAWDAVDKRLWGHAFLIASAASRDLFKKVAQEFVRKEVNTPGLSNEPLAALYEVLSGNHEECVDELVPIHARAGLQLMTTQSSLPQFKDDLAGLDKWRETLCLILSNRSMDDVQAINSLGNLLSGYGRAEAAHVCFLFSRTVTIFGGLDDPVANFVLLGADHKRQVDSFGKETDAVLLSEVYEYGLSLTGASNLGVSNSPHLAAYKLQHAMTLAEYGFRDKALQYCEAIISAMSAQTRRSPYYHPVLESAVEDLMNRLKQAPKEESNSWIPKPNMNMVSDSVWNRFNKFVAGDDHEGASGGSDGEAGTESGPFARIASGTPTISRPPSAGGGATGMEMFGGAAGVGYGLPNGSAAVPPPPPMPVSRTASRYAPGAASQPIPVAPSAANPYEPNTGYTPLGVTPPMTAPVSTLNPYEPTTTSAAAYSAPASRRVSSDQYAPDAAYLPSRQSSELSLGYSPYAANSHGSSAEPPPPKPSISRQSSYAPLPQTDPAPAVPGYAPPPATAGTSNPAFNPYAPTNNYASANGSPYAPASVEVDEPSQPHEEKAESPAAATPQYGYQPPSYGYQHPSMNTSFEPVSDAPAAAADAEPAEDAEGQVKNDANGYGGYEPPSFQPYSYEPPSYAAEASPEDGANAGGNNDEEPKPKKKSFMDDADDDDIPSLKQQPQERQEKTREEKDCENAEMFRKIAEEEGKSRPPILPMNQNKQRN